MTDEKWNSSFFLSVLFARAVLVPLLAVHWLSLGSTLLLDVPMDWAAEMTSVVVALLVVASLAMLWVFRNKATVVERRRRGPAELLNYSALSLAFAIASGAAGIALFLAEEYSAAWWMQTLGVGVALFETYGLVGTILLAAVRSPSVDGGDTSE
jgi:hypothetical protein